MKQESIKKADIERWQRAVPAMKNEFTSCPSSDGSSSSISDLHKRNMDKLKRSTGREQQHNSLTVTRSLPPPLHPSCLPYTPLLHSGHSRRSCPLPSGMWMCIMEMDGGWLCHTVEQTDSSLNACLPASISLPPTAHRNRAQAWYWPAQVWAATSLCTISEDCLTSKVRY